ncbi:acyl-coenzyme A thioesterase 13-like [Mizuhopecten yessoensis]|uniref:Acyl-coenzyme A thioesterase 13 n=2 Tax=Mizuhopecten yessoensis TaxID=6573 RepID=A0A210R1D3_MIZYE|nr:acyl-coenzyme A thioesterase 13-like [Mizuhopecten yessoensis]OWF54776.1 Acyl-coenzyme A thioesterase 13 [Mizuhopecten yessoensis]
MTDNDDSLRLSRQIQNERTSLGGFETGLKRLRIVSGGDGSMVCEMDVLRSDKNSHGTLHGGLICTLADTVSSWAFHVVERTQVSVSTDLHVMFMKPALVGTTIIIEARTVKRGKKMVFLEVTIKDKEKGFIVAKVSHSKLILDVGTKLVKSNM